MRCLDCTHLKAVHFSQTGEAVPCRLTGCKCQAFRAPDATAQPSTEGRRICIDVPDGYMVSVSLVPYTAEAVGDDEEEAA